MSALFISFAFFCLIGAAAVALYVGVFTTHRAVDDRFADLAVKMRVTQGSFENATEYDPNLLRMIFKWAAKKVPAPDLDSPQGEKLAQTLAQAGYLKAAAPHFYQVVRALLAAGCGAIGLLIGVVLHNSVAQPLLFAIGGVGVGIFVPSYYIGRRARIRQNNIARQLSDVLDLLVVCVEAGLGLYEAIRIVGTECEHQGQEIGTELSLVSSEISAGATLGAALRNLAERTAVDDIKPLAATLIQSEQLGAQIGPALHASSDALRMRRRLRAEEQAQKASIKILFPLVLFILPAMIAVIVGPAMIQVVKTIGGQ
ncbi:MAG TPA: type II secretion system F family protein [Candidatus Binataceae bacterium]|nr:type II secretion system F family protein [Candidatus Binataceae bacterium]